MTKYCNIRGRKVAVELVRRRVKNINMRVGRDGVVHISAGSRVPEKVIFDFVAQKEDFIAKALEKYEIEAEAAERLCGQGDGILLFGGTVGVNIHGSDAASVRFCGGIIDIAVKDTGDGSADRLLRKFLRSELERAVEPFLAKADAALAAYGKKVTAVKYRDMTSRWGSCACPKNVITLSARLVRVPPECIEYVVFHEYTHLLHQNHSKEFYAALGRFLPDWAERRALLRKYEFVMRK